MGQRVAIVQRDIHWLDAERNLHDIEQMLAGVEADVVVLSEMFSTGFATDPREVADCGEVEHCPQDGLRYRWLGGGKGRGGLSQPYVLRKAHGRG